MNAQSIKYNPFIMNNLQKEWEREGKAIFEATRRTFSSRSNEAETGRDTRETFRDGRIIINYQVNVVAFYDDLLKRLDETQLGLEYTREKCRRRLAKQSHY
mmetsp:Transcript_6277/g.13622  ORF Transcript_6277/g.13622 Transcript_6277/m.13622 type:complete len:101 (+) Transcript_6277:83-385(+)